MNSQEHRNLQEAYLEVYEQEEVLDEVRGGGRIDPVPVPYIPGIGERGARSSEDAGLLMSPLDRAKARANALTKRGGRGDTQRANQINSRFVRPTERTINRSLLAVTNAKSAEKKRLQALNNSYNPDLFDVILEYLINDGYADTNENALVIMANMSEEWRESVISEMPFQVTGPDPRSSDPNSPHVSIGRPYQSRKNAQKTVDKLDAKMGGYLHRVKYV